MARNDGYVYHKVYRRIPWFVWQDKTTHTLSTGAEKPEGCRVLQKTTRLIGIDTYRMPVDQFIAAAELVSQEGPEYESVSD